MNLSKSKYINGVQCKKKLWLEQNKPEEKENIDNESIFKTGNFIHEVAKYLFDNHININFSENLNDMIKDTQYTIESYDKVVITEASFNYDNNFCSVDILKKIGSKYEMYEFKGTVTVKDVYIKDASYQYYVLKSLGLNIQKCFIVILNKDYERHGNLDLNKLFIKVDVTESVEQLFDEVKENIYTFNKILIKSTEPDDDIDSKCFKPYPCPFYNYCTKHLPQPNIFDIADMHLSSKLKLYKEGIVSYKDVLKQDINQDLKQQIEYELYDKEPYINKHEIRKFMNTLSYPLYFLDFESYQQPIPLFDNVRPYQQVPFQYSLHFIKEEGKELKHTEFLGDGVNDPRKDLALKLVHDIPKDVCVVAYNMSFEKGIIKNLANIYPDLKDHLMNIHDNIKDLIVPFNHKYYYSKSLKGLSTIKYVLPALYPDDPSLNYHNLDMIHNGSEAMSSYANLKDLSNEEQEKIRYNMLKYCELDTYAMVKIWEFLKQI